MAYETVESIVGGTPLIRLQRLPGADENNILLKLEGNNPAGSVKDRPAISMIAQAEAAGKIQPGDNLIEATSGNTGIALAMAAAVKGYNMTLIMPENATLERRAAMHAYGAKLILVGEKEGMEGARDLALAMEREGQGRVLNQFGNTDNPLAHYSSTGPEIWAQTNGQITHFISSMGTTGTIVGTSKFLKEQRKDITVIGLQPEEGASIPGIRRWPKAYLPSIFTDENIDKVVNMSQVKAEQTMRALAKREGILAGVSSGGAVAAALDVCQGQKGLTVVAIVCDRGDRYLSSGVFDPN